MKKVNKKVEAMRQKNAKKKAVRKSKRKNMRLEAVSRRNNAVQKKKDELFEQWVASVNSYFAENPQGDD